jgi:hypothetical protein
MHEDNVADRQSDASRAARVAKSGLTEKRLRPGGGSSGIHQAAIVPMAAMHEPHTREERGSHDDEHEDLILTLQTEFRGKTREEIRRAIAQADEPPAVARSRNYLLERARVILGAGCRG